MKRLVLVLGAVGAMAFGATSSIAAPRSFSWTGAYVGVLGTYGWGTVGNSAFDPTFGRVDLPLGSTGLPSTSVRGGLGGIEAGFNWDFKSLVAGIEGDVSLGDIQGKTTVSCLPFCFGATPTSFSFSTDYESLATLRARVGASWNRVLFFATGGLATAKVTDQLTPPNSGAGRASYSQSGYLVGGTAGVGAEVALNRNWSLKGEYLFTWLPTRTLSVPGAYGMSPTDADTQTFTHTFNVVRFALNYRFK